MKAPIFMSSSHQRADAADRYLRSFVPSAVGFLNKLRAELVFYKSVKEPYVAFVAHCNLIMMTSTVCLLESANTRQGLRFNIFLSFNLILGKLSLCQEHNATFITCEFEKFPFSHIQSGDDR